MVEVIAQDALGAGLTMVEDGFGGMEPLMTPALTATETSNAPRENGTIRYKYSVSGHSTFTNVAVDILDSIKDVGSTTNETVNLTYVETDSTALKLEDIDNSTACPEGKNPRYSQEPTIVFITGSQGVF